MDSFHSDSVRFTFIEFILIVFDPAVSTRPESTILARAVSISFDSILDSTGAAQCLAQGCRSISNINLNAYSTILCN